MGKRKYWIIRAPSFSIRYITISFLFSSIIFLSFRKANLQLRTSQELLSFHERAILDKSKPPGVYNGPAPSLQPSIVDKAQQLMMHNNDTYFQSSTWISPRLTNGTMVVIVMTARAHTERRKVIRETWGNGHDNVYFIISAACPFPKWQMKFESPTCEQVQPYTSKDIDLKHKAFTKTQEEELEKEQRLYKDMIYTPKPESYHGLVHKLKEGYDWVIRHTKADWILKVDDDTYARVDSVANYLRQISPLNPIVIGDIIWSSPVRRDGKWAEHPNYKKETYPPWARGASGHVVSRPIAEFISRNKSSLYEYQGEDTSMAIWLDESPLKKNVDWRKSQAFAFHGDCYDPEFLVIGHELVPDKMRLCYENLDEIN
mmetsp:Transcript_13612/g.20720  ORF Transcript_13612/g.20720 Transcript_13612/m.20720 type:complete len:372 (-) Transcript_13612:78-1193(-)